MDVEPQPSLNLSLDLGPLMKAMEELGAVFGRMAGQFLSLFQVLVPPDPHHPPKLCIDGHEYRRRQRRRRKHK